MERGEEKKRNHKERRKGLEGERKNKWEEERLTATLELHRRERGGQEHRLCGQRMLHNLHTLLSLVKLDDPSKRMTLDL